MKYKKIDIRNKTMSIININKINRKEIEEKIEIRCNFLCITGESQFEERVYHSTKLKSIKLKKKIHTKKAWSTVNMNKLLHETYN